MYQGFQNKLSLPPPHMSCDFMYLHDIIRHSGVNEVFHGVSVEILVFTLGDARETPSSTQAVLILCGMAFI